MIHRHLARMDVLLSLLLLTLLASPAASFHPSGFQRWQRCGTLARDERRVEGSRCNRGFHMSQYDDGVSFAGGLIGNDVEAPDFDPLGLSVNKSTAELKWYREAEITHGRVAMLAVLGWLVPDTKNHWDNAGDNAMGQAISELLFGRCDF
ncbi:unnamed protein product [Discosporangium mesarthrocarpum]